MVFWRIEKIALQWPSDARVTHQCLTTIDLGSRAALPWAARADSADAIFGVAPL
jgi:hypothetical protein